MAKQMQALVYEGPKEMNMRTADVPQLNDNEVLIRVQSVGICGSELSGYLGKNSLRVPPLIMGHEFAGVVEQVGSQSMGVKVGDRVTANPLISCNRCQVCLSGLQHLCAERKLIGAHQPGAFAEYVKVTVTNVYALPEHVTMDQGALAEPFACGIHMIRMAGLTAVDKLLITGAGPIGLFALRAAQLFGLQKVVITDLNPERLAIAKEMGGITVSSPEEITNAQPKLGFDAAIDAVGLQSTRQQSMDRARAGGKVIFSGLHAAQSELPVNLMIRQELKLYGAFAYTPLDFSMAVDWISEGKVDFSAWIKHLPLSEGKRGFELLLDDPGKTAKVLLSI